MTSNPNTTRITGEMWRYWEALAALEPGSQLGGIYANKSGYHNTRAGNTATNYSVREAPDQQGPNDKAAAIDWTFPNAQRGDYGTIAKYCNRLYASGKNRNDPRMDGWREFYGQTDNDSHVEGWDFRHLVDITSDNSHLWHIHMSITRANVAVWSVYDAALSVLSGEPLDAWKARTGTTVPPVVTPPPATAHRPGSRTLRLVQPHLNGEDVRFVQKWIGPAHAGTADGDYGTKTRDGVRWYQRLRGISVDGEVGPQTWRQMGIR